MNFNTPAMKAIVCSRYGSPDVLQLKEVDRPVPADNEVLIRNYAASVSAADGMMRKGSPFYGRLFLGLNKPKQPVMGTGFAGIVEEAGANVIRFKAGDPVFGETGVQFGANAEFLSMPEDGLIESKPDALTFSEAACICDGALTAYNFLTQIGSVQNGDRVLVNGASGSIGTSAIQLATYFGAEVTAVCSASNADLVKELGADKVIDYNQTDFTQTDAPYDLIFDTVGKSTFPACKAALTENGVYLSPVLGLPLLLQMMWTSKLSRRKARFSATGMLPVNELRKMLAELLDIMEAGNLKLVMDRHYPLHQAAEAHQYVEQGHKRGNVTLSINEGQKAE